MRKLRPPPLATWILSHLAPSYRRDSFIGDLIEAVPAGPHRELVLEAGWCRLRTDRYQAAAECILRPGCGIPASRCQRISDGNESALVDLREARANASLNLLPPLTLAGLALLCWAVSALCAPSPRPPRSSGKLSFVKRLLTAFAAITLSAATLTWAGTTTGAVSHAPPAISCPSAY